MNLVEAQKEAIRTVINADPTEVTIEQVRYVEEAGARMKEEKTLGPLDVMLRPGIRSSLMAEEAGIKYFEEWEALVDGDVIKEEIIDSLTLAGVTEYEQEHEELLEDPMVWGGHAELTFISEEYGRFRVTAGLKLRAPGDDPREKHLVGYHLRLQRVS